MRSRTRHELMALLLLAAITSSQEPNEFDSLPPEIFHIDPSYQQSQQMPMHRLLGLEMEDLSPRFDSDFIDYFHKQEDLSINSQAVLDKPGHYLTLVGKMHLYKLIPTALSQAYSSQGRLLLAYFYFKIAAEKYQNPEAYYMLGILEFYRLTPSYMLYFSLHTKQRLTAEQEKLKSYFKKSHLLETEHALYMASLLGHNGATYILAHLHKEGIGMEKNCTVAAAYYLSIIKNTYIETYQFRSTYDETESFERELYAKKKVDLSQFREMDVSLLENSAYIDQETFETMSPIAGYYYVGKMGYPKNYTRSMKIYALLAQSGNQMAKAMLGLGYFKGQGVPLDRSKAYKLFAASRKIELSSYMITIMKYYQIEGAEKIPKDKVLASMEKRFLRVGRKGLSSLEKYFYGSVIAKGQLPKINVDEGYLLLEEAAANRNVMALTTMSLLFLQPPAGLVYDCSRATDYMQQESIEYPFFMDKIQAAKIGLRDGKTSFTLMKYLELSMIGHQESFVNSIYLLDVYRQDALDLSGKPWQLSEAKQNTIYQGLQKMKIVPNIEDYFKDSFSFYGKEAPASLNERLQDLDQYTFRHQQYITEKLIKVSEATQDIGIIQFYAYKQGISKEEDSKGLLRKIAARSGEKEYVLEARFLLAREEHRSIFVREVKEGEIISPAKKYSLIKEYNLASKSELLGQLIYYVEDYLIGGRSLKEEFLSMEVINDLLSYLFVLSLAAFVLFYLRSKKLDELNTIQRERIQDNLRREQAQHESMQANDREEKIQHHIDRDQPVIVEDSLPEKRGVLIGGDP